MKSVADLCQEFLTDKDVVSQFEVSEQQRKYAFCHHAQSLYQAMQSELVRYFEVTQNCEVQR